MDAEKFGTFITQCRKEKNLTQAELASKLQITDKAVSRWERGKGFPDISLLVPLADALDLSVLELMRSEKLESETQYLQDEQTTAELMVNAVEMERLNQRQDHFLSLTVGLVTLAAAGVIYLFGHVSIGGALTAGIFVSFAVIGLCLQVLNRADTNSRKAYGIFILFSLGFAGYLLYLCGIDPAVLLLGLFFVLAMLTFL